MHTSLDAFQPDILHVADPALLGVAALYYSGGPTGGRLGLPLIVSYHTDLPQYLHHFGLGFIEPAIWPILRIRHQRATRNLCTSKVVLEQLRTHGIRNTSLWPGGVDADLHAPSRRSEAMRHRLAHGRSGPLLLYAGRLSPEKEIERLKAVLKGVPGASLALVGDGPHRRTLEAHFAGMPVEFLGFLHGEELATAYASSDVFVMPSRSETLGLVVLEAMSAGLPVVAARAGGIPELVEHGVNGLLFEDEASAVGEIDHLLAHPQAAADMRRNARETALGHSWDAATEILLTHYRGAVEEFRARQPNSAMHPEMALEPAGPRQQLERATRGVIRKLLP
jgi:glycosyltransferase involved in cell wall biosynthesis